MLNISEVIFKTMQQKFSGIKTNIKINFREIITGKNELIKKSDMKNHTRLR
ncbi:MAG: hypothetical protein ACTSQY_04115 [Candidatus Odinarchaeia archaeon]